MNRILKYGLPVIAAVGLASCNADKETEGVSRITYYCDLELKGAPTIIANVGTPYAEPGYIAKEAETDVTAKVTVSGAVNTAVPGMYKLTYSVSNQDGFPKTAVRTVIVADATSSALESGLYTVASTSDRNGTTAYGKDFTILIYQQSPGVFYISDFLGGWYEQRAGYGGSYAMIGTFSFDGSNLSMRTSHIAGWDDGLDEAAGDAIGTYAAATKTITYTVHYVGAYAFNVTATKQ
jgi:hypothetical protein